MASNNIGVPTIFVGEGMVIMKVEWRTILKGENRWVSQGIALVLSLLLLSIPIMAQCTCSALPDNRFQPPSLHIHVGTFNVTVLSHSNMPDLLFERHPEVQGNPVVESFVEQYDPRWVYEDTYFNDSVGAPTPVSAVLVVALNQSGFWQLVFSANVTESTQVRWICMVSGHRMPVNASHILLTAVEHFAARFPEESIILSSMRLSVEGGDPPVKKLVWHLSIEGSSHHWAYIMVIDTNGTVLLEYVLPPHGPPPLSFIWTLLVVAGVGIILLVVVVVGFFRTRAALRRV